MSPGGRRRDDWWDRPYAPRLAVQGGVRVGKPGTVSGEEAVALVALAVRRTTSGVAARARTYARQGQLVELRVDPQGAAAAIQGSDALPYAVSLDRVGAGDVEAACTCPYGCDHHEWCKHAAALAYVVADLVDREPAVLATWLGEDTVRTVAAEADRAEIDAIVGTLRGPRPQVDAAAQWAAAAAALTPPS